MTEHDPEPAAEFPDGLQWIGGLPDESDPRLYDDLGGHVVLVHFYCASVPACVEAAQVFGLLEHWFADQPFAVVGVHVPRIPGAGDPDRAARDAERLGLRHRVALDPDWTAREMFGIEGWPGIVLVDAEGNERFRGVGVPRLDALVQAIEALLEEAQTYGLGYGVGYDGSAGPAAGFHGRDTDGDEGVQPAPRFVADMAASAEGLVVVEEARGRIVAVGPDRGAARALAEGPWRPAGVCALDAGDGGRRALVVAEPLGARLMRVVPGPADAEEVDDAALETLLAGAPLVAPTAVGTLAGSGVVDGAEDLLVADPGAHKVWRCGRDGRGLRPWLGDGADASRDGSGPGASCSEPGALAVAPAGVVEGRALVWLCDRGSGRLRRVLVDVASADALPEAVSVADLGLHAWSVACLDDGRAIVLDPFGGKVAVVGPDGVIERMAAALPAGAPRAPACACLDTDGSVLVADRVKDGLWRLRIPGDCDAALEVEPVAITEWPAAADAPVRAPDAVWLAWYGIDVTLPADLTEGELHVHALPRARIRQLGESTASDVLSAGRSLDMPCVLMEDGSLMLHGLATGQNDAEADLAITWTAYFDSPDGTVRSESRSWRVRARCQDGEGEDSWRAPLRPGEPGTGEPGTGEPGTGEPDTGEPDPGEPGPGDPA